LRLDPANDLARISLVKALTALAEFDEALPLIQELCATKSQRIVDAHYLLGSVFAASDNTQQRSWN